MRVVIIAACALGAAVHLKSMHDDFSNPSWSFALVMIAFCSFGVFFLIALQKINPRALDHWQKPSWNSSLFNYRQPAQAFQDCELCLLGGSIGYLFVGFDEPRLRWAWELLASSGAGALLGVRLSLWAFSEQFSE